MKTERLGEAVEPRLLDRASPTRANPFAQAGHSFAGAMWPSAEGVGDM